MHPRLSIPARQGLYSTSRDVRLQGHGRGVTRSLLWFPALETNQFRDRYLSLRPQEILAIPVPSRGMPDSALYNILGTRGVGMRKQMRGLGDSQRKT